MLLLVHVVLVCGSLTQVRGHGRMFEPPGRSTAWRYGFSTPSNVNDHQLYCGGFTRQWKVNKGRCGICGDPWDQTQPRSNEAGGLYGTGLIVRSYRRGAVIPIGIELTANHKGFFEMRICATNDPAQRATQRCLDANKLQLADGGGVRYFPGGRRGKIKLRYLLPDQLSCSHCVVQWRYVAGNNWGHCENGTGRVGCGPQEEFRACADVKVVNEDGSHDETSYDWPAETTTTTTKTTTEGEEPTVPQDSNAVLFGETLAAILIGVICVVAFFSTVCCYASWRRKQERRVPTNKKKRGVTFGRQIFLISNPTLTRGGKKSSVRSAEGLSQSSNPLPVFTNGQDDVSSSDGSTFSMMTPQFAGDETLPNTPEPPKRRRASASDRQTPVVTSAATCGIPPPPLIPAESYAWKPSHRDISRPTNVTVNGVSVIPDPPRTDL